MIISDNELAIILFKIWRVSRDIRAYVMGQDRLVYAMRVLAESGALYAMTAAICLSTILARSTAVYLTADCASSLQFPLSCTVFLRLCPPQLVQITGICFNLIIIRFDRNLASKSQIETEFNSRVIPLSYLTPSNRGATNGPRSVQRMEIEVTQGTEVDGSSFTEETKSGVLKIQPLGV